MQREKHYVNSNLEIQPKQEGSFSRRRVPAFGEDSKQEAPAPTKVKPSALDVQVGGSHYKDNKIQPIEFIQANRIGFIEGNIIKYIVRWREKNGLEDLLKIKNYVDLLIELEGLDDPK